MFRSEKFKITGIGEILWDLLPNGKQLGGAPANFVYHCKALGCDGYAVSSVGNDVLGKEILARITDLHINPAFIQIDRKHPTGTVDIKIDQDGLPDYIIHEQTAWDNIHFNESHKKLALQTDAVSFGSLAQRAEISRETINRFLKATRKDCLRIFDINLRQNFYNKEIIENSLHIANYFKLNEDELSVIAKMFSVTGSEEKIIDTFFKTFKLELIALTKGAKGSDLYTLNSHSYMKTTSQNIQDTVGAGDAFTAALAFFSLEKKPLKDIHHNATTLAAFVCTQKGATPNISSDVRSQLK